MITRLTGEGTMAMLKMPSLGSKHRVEWRRLVIIVQLIFPSFLYERFGGISWEFARSHTRRTLFFPSKNKLKYATIA